MAVKYKFRIDEKSNLNNNYLSKEKINYLFDDYIGDNFRDYKIYYTGKYKFIELTLFQEYKAKSNNKVGIKRIVSNVLQISDEYLISVREIDKIAKVSLKNDDEVFVELFNTDEVNYSDRKTKDDKINEYYSRKSAENYNNKNRYLKEIAYLDYLFFECDILDAENIFHRVPEYDNELYFSVKISFSKNGKIKVENIDMPLGSLKKENKESLKLEPIHINISKVEPFNNYSKVKDELKSLGENVKYSVSYRKKDIARYNNNCNDMKFVVYNVGQALATSLNIENKRLFYFDYGYPLNNQSKYFKIKPKLEVDEDTVIYISHLHYDHVSACFNNIDSYKCKWYIPNQPEPMFFSKIRERIEECGGEVEVISNDYNIKINDYSNIGHVYNFDYRGGSLNNSGNAFVLNLNSKCVLVPGDLPYDVMYEKLELRNRRFNVLVATHHGGKYKLREDYIYAFPILNEDAKVVFSYGKGNSYGHPFPEHISYLFENRKQKVLKTIDDNVEINL